ncbi:IS6 family transposase [Candidatus Bathyarchaeota archaeon]|nr:IS6 family transposase [Candidatus Bathyarchaeota archaeon]
MMCKYCTSEKVVKDGKVKGKQQYVCRSCGHKFIKGSDFPKMRVESRIISTAIDMYYEGLSVRKVKTQLEKIYGIQIGKSAVWKWVMKYSALVSQYVETLTPQLLGVYHVDETAIKCKGVQKWFWEIIDEQTKFLVAGHLSGSRTTEDAIALFEKSIRVAKNKPTSIYCDGLPAYVDGYNKVFRTMKKEGRPELIRRVGIRNVHNQNAVERLHGTLKDRLKPTRGLKGEETVRTLLEGWVVHYNYVRKHQTIKMTPAQASGIIVKNDWNVLVKEATRFNALNGEKESLREKPREVVAK